ncbi:hypothetical protein BASA81_015747 [Batrachochytrium salamandrivorans]|nr:hypothetical protein BASA81_015747 [Batrachochytrium salamandrivorans]
MRKVMSVSSRGQANSRRMAAVGGFLLLVLLFQLYSASAMLPVSPAVIETKPADVPVEVAVVVEPVEDPNLSTITIITGTHFSPELLQVDERNQPAQCEVLAVAIHQLWSAWEVGVYASAKSQVRDALKLVAGQKLHCVLTGSRKHSMLWTFPLTWRPDAQCDSKMKQMLTNKQYIREKTKVYVNWFLLRPDLVTLANMASVVPGVHLRFAVSVGTQVSTAAFSQEVLCPRINTILDKREVYKQRFLLVVNSDVEHQLQRIRDQQVTVFVREACDQLLSDRFHSWAGVAITSQHQCPPELSSHQVGNHLASLWHMQLFAKRATIPKTVFTGPRLVFVAGLEGVGHHVFSLLGRKHTTRDLYDALTDHLCDSAWDDDSETKYVTARERLVDAMRKLTTTTHVDNLVFLNTVYVERDVNMYSFPWGGPRCYLKRYARVLCNIDVIELAQMAEEAGVDFRIIFLKRSIGAAVVSASLHRPFGTLVSETRMLALSWALLKSGMEAIDRKFVLEITYEDMINNPPQSTSMLGEFMGFPPQGKMHEHVLQTLTESNLNHPVGDGTRWKEEVDMSQFQFMSDLLGSSKKNKSNYTAKGVVGDDKPAEPRKEAEKRHEPSFPIRTTQPIKRHQKSGGGD